ncbi:family 20 glycosylhydrolase [Niabella beijingensis]|uniref:family 20 glycosylhydrolase n=1 Tax=Niabella beijingensis TaxID=2872700 RepID=UPI001CBF096F|nr:family 20 glycosylhydrolase [Niabella beijingensis]MBZ4192142.1 family 20 glycosylhydrolase [Niabella beijingensis]
MAVIMNSYSQEKPAPDFEKKGFYIDLRNQVMTMEALKNTAKELAELGINTLVMEWDATYPYENNATISGRLAYTREEISSFVNYCGKIGIDVIPIQQCFGHVEYILRHDRYSSLREDAKDLSQVCPLQTTADSLLFSDLFRDMARLHPSKYLHIGADETRLLGHCAACKKKMEQEGVSRLFVDYVKMMCQIALKLGKTPLIWSDMILKHPEAAGALPKETIIIDWNYGWRNNLFGDIGLLKDKGFTIWGAPSIRSHPDNWYVTDWATHFSNQRDFIPYARTRNYKGMIMTSWSTSGVYSFIRDVGNEVVSMEPIRNNYPLSGFRILIAAYAWSLQQKQALDPEAFVIRYAKERFGLNDAGGKKLWEALMVPPELLIKGKPAQSQSIAALAARNNEAVQLLKELKPHRHQKEFEHFRLMADLRAYYLSFKEILALYNTADFSRKAAGALIPRVQVLLNQAKELDRRFSDLNNGFLKNPEIIYQNRIRNQPVQWLYERLAGINEK